MTPQNFLIGKKILVVKLPVDVYTTKTGTERQSSKQTDRRTSGQTVKKGDLHLN